MLKNFIEKNNYYWFFLILTALLCFGFALTNSSMGIDDELVEGYKNLTGILYTNRLGRIITAHVLQTWEYLPFWRDFLAVTLSIIGITMHADNFSRFLPEIMDKKAATIFACIAFSFPYIAFNSIFIVTCLEQGLILVLSAIAVLFFNKYFFEEKSEKYIFYTFITLVFIISLYESGVLYFLAASFFIVLARLIYFEKPEDAKKNKFFNRKYLLLAFFLSIISYIINMFLILIVEMFFRFRYLHIDDVFRYDLNSLPRFYHSFCHSLKNLITVFSQTLNYDFGSVMLLLSLIALFLIICFYSIKNKNIKIFIYGILLMIIPFSAFLLTGNFEWYYRVYTSFCITEGVTFILLYNLCKNNTKLLNIFFVFVSLIVLYQTKEFNQIFYTENLKFNNDVKFANSIKYDLERLNLDEKPVVFAGIRKDLPLKHHYYNESPEINVSTFNWDRYNNFDAEIFVKRPYAFMHELGIPVRGWWEIDDERFKEPDVFFNLVKANTKEMNIYPGKNSIRDFGSFVLIKIGRSQAEREEETERKE